MTTRQRLSFAYGNLALSTNHKPTRAAFKAIALSEGMTEAEFDEWAKDKQWWTVVECQACGVVMHPRPSGYCRGCE